MTAVPNSEFLDVLHTVQYSLFRLELQVAYAEPTEAESVARFIAGDPIDQDSRPGSVAWRGQVRTWRENGVRIERVRVHENPPTDYQRWVRWAGAWNIDAGEVMRYMTRNKAHDVGLLPAAGTVDWWLIDSCRLLELHFNENHERVRNELVENPTTVVQACAWRDLAVHHSNLETLQGIASQGIKL